MINNCIKIFINRIPKYRTLINVISQACKAGTEKKVIYSGFYYTCHCVCCNKRCMRNKCSEVYGSASIVYDKFVDLSTNMDSVGFSQHLLELHMQMHYLLFIKIVEIFCCYC